MFAMVSQWEQRKSLRAQRQPNEVGQTNGGYRTGQLRTGAANPFYPIVIGMAGLPRLIDELVRIALQLPRIEGRD